MSPVNFSYIVAAFFLFLLIFNRSNRPSSAILFLSFFVNTILVDIYHIFDPLNYQETLYSLIMYDGAFALIMTMANSIDKKAKEHAKIICLTILCHSMISLYLITENEALELISVLFYEHYEALLIVTATLHLLVSRNGMVRAINGYTDFIQSLSRGIDLYSKHSFKTSLGREKRKAKK